MTPSRRRGSAAVTAALALAALAAPVPAGATVQSLVEEAGPSLEDITPPSRYVCDLAGTSTTWEPFQYTEQSANPAGDRTYWYVRYVIEGTADCTRTSLRGVETLAGRLTVAGEGATTSAGNGQPRWDPETRSWDYSADDPSWGWLTEFYGAHTRFGWEETNGPGFYQGPFVPEHAKIDFPDGTSIEFGYFIRYTNESVLANAVSGEEREIGVFPATGPTEPTMVDTRFEDGMVSLRGLDGRRTFSARDVNGITLRAKGLKLGPSVAP